ncbi:hypothetical protein D7D25_09360 [Proteiniphilum sp. X52]|nr:hypothetical protein D7D25_09360 [Proteiniphilum sp. X52]
MGISPPSGYRFTPYHNYHPTHHHLLHHHHYHHHPHHHHHYHHHYHHHPHHHHYAEPENIAPTILSVIYNNAAGLRLNGNT